MKTYNDHDIAIVGMGCRYPDAESPEDLLNNTLAHRRAFRRFPDERLRMEDYHSLDRNAPDKSYATEAAVLEGFEFDRVRYRVAGKQFRSADMAHWLALDVATRALYDAGFPEAEGLPRRRTGVIIGNSLTGEFSRANIMRLRWPYVRRVMESGLRDEGWSDDEIGMFLARMEKRYKKPFPEISEETLAGGLANTIAGRICNYYDLHGGGYTVDGACASSLLAVVTACNSLAAGDMDVALAGGVDLSLDPFEIVGFAKTGALAANDMRVFEERSAGFWPGEGCGFVVLMRYADALHGGHRIYSSIRGWGISSDGSGGITRPEVEGQLQAVAAAYDKAGYGADSVTFFEGHGTGTAVGDETELKTLSRAVREAGVKHGRSFIASTKANIGHTKAAAGVAGLIKATMALSKQVIPPMTNHERPHPVIAAEDGVLQTVRKGIAWPEERPLRAGVSAMGFGGINTHLTLENPAERRRQGFTSSEQSVLRAAQDCELFLFGGLTPDDLRKRVRTVADYAEKLSRAQLADLAHALHAELEADAPCRAAVVASQPADLETRLRKIIELLDSGVSEQIDAGGGIMLGASERKARIGFLFPGQGAPANLDGGIFRRRFDFIDELYTRADLPVGVDGVATDVAQPAIVTASLAGMQLLERLGIQAECSVGHSLGEISALGWAGVADEDTLLRVAQARGRAMADLGSPTGAMASLGAGRQRVERLLDGHDAVVAGFNSARQTVISGERDLVHDIVKRAKASGISAVPLQVSHAFHSPLVAAAVPVLTEYIRTETFTAPQRTVYSTVSGSVLDKDVDIVDLLGKQVTNAVRFVEAATQAMSDLDLAIEVGPGKILSGLVVDYDVPTIALNSGGSSLRGLLSAAGAAFTLGVKPDLDVIFNDRFVRPFNIEWKPVFLINNCELAPLSHGIPAHYQAEEEAHEPESATAVGGGEDASPIDTIRRLVAERAELPAEAINDGDRMLTDLHLNSIAVSQLVIEAARELQVDPPANPTNYADASVMEIAEALAELGQMDESARTPAPRIPDGVDSWVRSFSVVLFDEAAPAAPVNAQAAEWKISTPSDYTLEEALRARLDRAPGNGGSIVCLPPDPVEADVERLLSAMREMLQSRRTATFVLVQHGGGAASMVRTLHLEAPEIDTVIVDVPIDNPQAAEWIMLEAATAGGHREVVYDQQGRRRVPRLKLATGIEPVDNKPLGEDDVLLVTGGGKGITAECALIIAMESGAALALLGRSKPENDKELASNLDRMRAAGCRLKYYPTDITDADSLDATLRAVQSDLGTISAVLHGAGANKPKLIAALEMDDFRKTLGPKVYGLRTILDRLDPARLKMLISFSSIIARSGMHGEADYALANEWLTRMTERYADQHPHVRALAIEWSVWSGVGMGERLGAVEALMQKGITPISPDAGIAVMRELICAKGGDVALVVSGRFGDSPTLVFDRPELPFRRFLEDTRFYVPGVELIVESELSLENDPYLNEHVFRGERLLPAVVGLEAMAQTAMALVGTDQRPWFEDAGFHRPVVVSERSPQTIRVAAVVRNAHTVDVVLRSGESNFQVDVFNVRCRFDAPTELTPVDETFVASEPAGLEAVPIEPATDLYGGIFFHTGRFQRVRSYRTLRATRALVEIDTAPAGKWFGRYLPQTLVLGDAAVRDAVIHSILACLPHATLLPIGVDELVPATQRYEGPVFVHANERLRDDKLFIYDVRVTDEQGRILESWNGLRLQMIAENPPSDAWVEALLGPYMERRISELVDGAQCTAVVQRDVSEDRHSNSDSAIRRALGREAAVLRRPDGKPELADDARAVSAAHADGLTFAVAGEGPLGCDLEPVVARPAQLWRDLLGPERFQLAELLARELNEDADLSATRVWEAGECLTKAGALPNAPLVFHSSTADGWVLFASGSMVAATYVGPLRNSTGLTALAILVRRMNEGV